MKKLLSIVLCAALSLTILTGCGSSNSGNSNAGNTANTSTTTLNVGIPADIDNFNPFTNQTAVYVKTINFNVFECLFHLNENMEYEMDLATSYEQIDDTTYVFHLREGVKFHNGEDFTAEDVIYTINTINDESVGAWRAATYANVESMTATDAHTLEIKLAEPQPAFLDNLAYTCIVSKSTTPDQLATTPIGTGAYKFASWTPNDNITLEKNADYWEADKINYEKLIMKVIPDATVALTNLKSGAIQYFVEIDAETASQVESTEGLKVDASKYANTVYEVEIGRHNNPALSDPDVIQAMFMAFDRQSVVDGVFCGMGSIGKSPFPTAATYYAEVDNDSYDIEAAKELLATTDYANGFEFDAYVLTNDTSGQQALVIWQDGLKQIGITMNIKISEMSVWLDAYLNRSYDMIANYYSMVGTDPATYCSILLSALCDYQTKDLPELNELINKAATTSDTAVRKEAYQQIQEIVAKYRPVATYAECPALNGASENLSGVIVNGMGHVIFKYASSAK